MDLFAITDAKDNSAARLSLALALNVVPLLTLRASAGLVLLEEVLAGVVADALLLGLIVVSMSAAVVEDASQRDVLLALLVLPFKDLGFVVADAFLLLLAVRGVLAAVVVVLILLGVTFLEDIS